MYGGMQTSRAMLSLSRSVAFRPVFSRPFVRTLASARQNNSFSLDQAGLLSDLYVPPANPPSWFTNPKQRWTVLKRNFQALGVNTYMAVKIRRELGRGLFNPIQWKEFSLLLYERTNECFAKRDFQGLQKVTSRWVYGPLSIRMKELSADSDYSWKLVKHNKKPKVLSLIPLMFPDMPLNYVQVVYRFDSMQELTKVNKTTGEAQTQARRVIDNIAFLVDTRKDPLEGRLIGSLFETRPQMAMPDMAAAATCTRAEAVQGMRTRGDIFRPEPEYLAMKVEK